jgi:hypothetical protein
MTRITQRRPALAKIFNGEDPKIFEYPLVPLVLKLDRSSIEQDAVIVRVVDKYGNNVPNGVLLRISEKGIAIMDGVNKAIDIAREDRNNTHPKTILKYLVS